MRKKGRLDSSSHQSTLEVDGRRVRGSRGESPTLLLSTVVNPLGCHDLDIPPGPGGVILVALGSETNQVSGHILLNITPELPSIALHNPRDAMALICPDGE